MKTEDQIQTSTFHSNEKKEIENRAFQRKKKKKIIKSFIYFSSRSFDFFLVFIICTLVKY